MLLSSTATHAMSLFKLLYIMLAFFRTFQGLLTWREEDPSTRKILEGGTSFRWVKMRKFRSEWLPRRRATRTKSNLDSSALFTGVNNYLSVELQ